MHGLNWYDFHARQYDPILARFHTIDPLAEKYYSISPYVYCFNNPLKYTDPTGKSGELTIDHENKKITVTSNLIMYGEKASQELAEKTAASIQSYWNNANGTVKIDGAEYSVSFTINGSYNSDLTQEDISSNTDVKNNYVSVVEKNSDGSSNFQVGGNEGEFLIGDLNKSTTTAAHEFGHGYGLDHHPSDLNLIGKGVPGIMYPRGTAVDTEYTYDPKLGATSIDVTNRRVTNTMNPNVRVVTKQDVTNLGISTKTFHNNRANLGRVSR